MEPDHMTERILHLTLEIISLLTGETMAAVKSGDQVTITATSHHFLMPKSVNKTKILEVTNKIIQMLTGEPESADNATIKEELEEMDEQEDGAAELGRADGPGDAVMADPRLLPSQDGANKGKHPERSLQSSSSKEDQDVQGHQGDVLINIKVEETDEEEMYEQVTVHCKEEEEEEPIPDIDTVDDVGETSGPHLAVSPDHNIEDKHFTRESRAKRTMIQTKIAGPSDCKEYLSDEPSLGPPEDDEVLDLSTAGCNREISERLRFEEESSPEESPPNTRHSSDPSKESSPGTSEGATDHSGGNKLYPCCQCGKTFMLQLLFGGRQRSDREPFTCCECQNRSKTKSPGSGQQEDSEVETTYYACPNCPKTFSRKTYLFHHQKIHVGNTNHNCSVCGKCFSNKSNLVVHARTHTGERPFPCLRCGKNFTHRSSLVRHIRLHTGEQPYMCSYCGKGFTRRSFFSQHERTHTTPALQGNSTFS